MVADAQFHDSLEWNPELDNDCSGLYHGWWVCVGIQPRTVTATFEYTITALPVEVPPYVGEYTPTTFPEINSSFAATPTQAGLAQDCRAFYQAEAVSVYAPFLNGHMMHETNESRGVIRATPVEKYWNTTSSRSSSSSRGTPLCRGTVTVYGWATGIA